MSNEHHERVQDLFLAALEQLPQDRASYVRQAAGADDQLAREVLELLQADASSGARLEAPAAALGLGSLFQAPERIGDYTIVGTLGEGGMGVVYEARQARPQRSVALKLLRWDGSRESLRRFKYEAEVLGFLQHPAIAHVYEAGVTDDALGARPFFSMELVQGLRIDDYVKQLGLRRDEIVHLVLRVLEGVHHAHQRGVVHRDLKPANIVVRDDGQPKILDFGIARAAETDVDRSLATRTGEFLGTLAYMAPEQVLARPDQIDVRADVYAVGVLLYELLAGVRPIEVGDVPLPVAMKRVLEEAPRLLDSLATETPTDLVTVVHKALEKDKERRYASAEALSDDLRRYLAREPVRARPPSRMYLAQRFVQRNRGVTVLGVVALSTLIGGAVTSTHLYLRERRANDDLSAARGSLQVQNAALVEARNATERANVELMAANTLAEERRALAEEQQALAEDRVQELHRSSDLMEDLLSNILLYEDGVEVKYSTVVERASYEVLQSLREQPQQRVWLATSLARTATRIGLNSRARELVEAARESLDKVAGNTQYIRLKLDHADAILRAEENDLDGARETHLDQLEELQALRMFHIEGIDESIVEVQLALSRVEVSRGEWDAAAAWLEAAEQSAASLDSDPRGLRISILGERGRTLLHRGAFQEARAALEECVRLLDARGEGLSAVRSGALNLLGSTLLNLGELEAARGHLTTALDGTRSLFGPKHPRTGTQLVNLATLEHRLEDRAAARRLYDEAEFCLRDAEGQERRGYAVVLSNRAALRTQEGDLEGAEEDLTASEQALTGLEGMEAALSRSYIVGERGQIALARGELEAAEELFQQSIQAKQQIFGAALHPAMKRDVEARARIAQQRGDDRLQVERELDVARIRRAVHGRDDPGVTQAVGQAREALERYRSQDGHDPKEVERLEKRLKSAEKR